MDSTPNSVSRAGAWTLVSLLLIAGVAIQTGQADDGPSTQTVVDYVDLPRAGGNVKVSTTVLENAGPRFLEFVAPPTFTRTEEARAMPDLVPGAKGDQGGEDLLVTQREGTDYDYMKEDWTGSIWMEDVNPSENEGWLCVCDAVFVMANENGRPPELGPDRTLQLFDSSRIWFDNITFYGAAIVINSGENFIFSNSRFVDSGGIAADPSSDHGLVHNVSFTEQWGVLQPYHHPPNEVELVLGDRPMCWPHDINLCSHTGASVLGSKNWTFEWNHLHGEGALFATGEDTIMRHNTLYDGGHLAVSLGTNEISWNLIRGRYSADNMDARGSDYTEIHNNSIIRPFKVDHGEIDQSQPGLRIINCEQCRVRDNDFIGYAQYRPSLPPPFPFTLSSRGEWALGVCGPGTTDASSNYWGTLTDPREPEDFMITTCDGATLVLEDWQTEPNHPLNPIVLTHDINDPPYWVERIVRDQSIG